MEEIKYLKKVVRIRKHLIREKKSGIQTWRALQIIQELEKYINAYPSASSEFWKRFIKKKYEDIIYLIPINNTKEKLINELNRII